MSYNPYANMADADGAQSQRMHHPQPQQAPQQFQQQNHQQRQQQQNFSQYPQPQPPQQGQFFNPSDPNAYTQFFSDPKAAMTFQVGQNAMMAGSQYMEQEFQKYVPTGAFKYYFKVSNTYVLSKLLLILFPFKNKNWTRSYRKSENDSGVEAFAFPLDDTNAPDFYIPLMGIVTYIILTAILAGINGEFSPALFSYQWTMSIAYLLLDLAILKGGLYLLNINSTIYDLIAYMGYKFVPLLLIVLIKNISQMRILNWVAYVYLIIAYGFFELRAIRFNLFGGINNSAQSLSSKTVKNSNYFLFVYAFAFQSILIWALGRYC
jgi:hypothetical protein